MPYSPKPQDAAIVAAHQTLPSGAQVGADDLLLLVSVAEQRLVVAQGRTPLRSFAVSTAVAGTGSEQNSEKTPLGWHRVSDWIGGDARPGQVFVSRRPTKEVLPYTQWQASGGGDYVLTRILWLDGLEAGRNKGGAVDSHARYIYFHGTNQEQLLGRPASHGCIRLSNRDVMELYDLTVGHATWCRIVESF